MKLIKPYNNLDETLLALKLQARESINYALDVLPAGLSCPEQLFYLLKDNTTYTSDPRATELLMTMQTMMSGERTGTPGAGDCDDFTITALACLAAIGINRLFVSLVGRSKRVPVHIYAAFKDRGSQQLIWFDLTNPWYNYQRNGYSYQQVLPINLI